jgi:signal transduction histidine kinase
MGTLLRLTVFIFVLGALAAGVGAMLVQERQREQILERMIAASRAEPAPPDRADDLLLLREMHARTQRALLLYGGLALGCVLILAVLPPRNPTPSAETTPASSAARTEMRGLESLARATAAQRVELDRERDARHRSEEDLNLQQLLANRALQEKIHLGRDLHDGLVQTLYATGLVLEAAGQRLAPPAADPAEAARLLERAKSTLNAAIREARGAIGELSPDVLAGQSLAEAVATILDHLDGGRLRARHVELSPALPALPDATRTELLQIVRESVSNALRHGGATEIAIDFAPLADGRLRLVVRDDGRGFDPVAVTRGRGLDNLAARARALAAQLLIDAAPGRGTVITVTLPEPAAVV